jgi:hypothetical protein
VQGCPVWPDSLPAPRRCDGQRLNPTGGRGNLSGEATTASTPPPPSNSLRVEASHPLPLGRLLSEHHLLVKRGDRTPTALPRQQCFEHCRWREVPPQLDGESVVQSGPRQAMLQHVTHRVHPLVEIFGTYFIFIPMSFVKKIILSNLSNYFQPYNLRFCVYIAN